MRKLVTMIVAGLAFCFMLSLPAEAAATQITTQDNTKAVVSTYIEMNVKYVAKSAKEQNPKQTKQQKKRQTKKKSKKKYTKKDLRYMTAIIYCEAQGESYQGKKAVGIVVMNRVRSSQFPNTVKKVIYQSGQFSPIRNGSMSKALDLYDMYNKKGKFKGPMKSCLKAAKEALSGSTTVKVNGENKQMKKYLFFSRYVPGAKFQLGGHQFK